MDAHEKWMVERNKLLDWVDAHCKIIDDGHDRIGQFIGPDGTITTRMYRTGYPEEQCDSKPPAPLPPWQERYKGEPVLPYRDKLRNAECRDMQP